MKSENQDNQTSTHIFFPRLKSHFNDSIMKTMRFLDLSLPRVTNKQHLYLDTISTPYKIHSVSVCTDSEERERINIKSETMHNMTEIRCLMSKKRFMINKM